MWDATLMNLHSYHKVLSLWWAAKQECSFASKANQDSVWHIDRHWWTINTTLLPSWLRPISNYLEGYWLSKEYESKAWGAELNSVTFHVGRHLDEFTLLQQSAQSVVNCKARMQLCVQAKHKVHFDTSMETNKQKNVFIAFMASPNQ